MARIAGVSAFLLAVAFSAEVLGYHARPFNRFLSLLFLAVFLYRYFPRDVISRFRRRSPGLLLTVAALIGVFCSTGWIGVMFICLLVGGMILSRLNEDRDVDLKVFQTTAFAYGVLLLFWRETATGWYLLDGVARGLMWVTHSLGLKATLGPTALGMPVILLLLTYGTVCTLSMPGNRLWTMLKLVASLFLVQIVFAAMHDATVAALSINVVRQQNQGAMMPWSPFAFLRHLYPNNLQVIALLLASAATLVLTPAPLQRVKVKAVLLRRWPVIAGAGVLLIGAMLAAFVPPRTAAKGNVLICDSGYLDFRMPVFGSYGHKNGGMFGRLPQFLEASGYNVRRGTVSHENLRSTNVLVVINLMDKFDRHTKRKIWDFVRKGGSLLVLGDHTCTHNIREPINDLLEPVNIGLNFDSAKPFRDGWLWAYSMPRHATTMGIDDATNDIQIWIGASLTVAPPARPVIIGSYGFSDPGDMSNARQGYLGNLQFDPGEKLGDVLLAAECQYGRGKVLVFGDTSTLQNDALVYSHRFVENTFAWLCRSRNPAHDAARLGIAALLIVAGILLLAVWARTSFCTTMAAVALLLGWALGAVPAKLLDVPSSAHNNIAWIDASHLERFSFNGWVDQGFGGLTHNLMRNGYSPLLMKDWDTRALKRGSLLILIGPSKPFSPSEVKSIRQFMEGGGHLVLAAGWEDLAGSKELWKEFGLRVQQRPLGRVLVKQPGGDVRLYKGWSIKTGRGDPDVLCSPWGYPAIVRLRVGRGSLVAIADTQFLLNRNLEGTEQYYPENINFLRRLFSQLKQNQTEPSGLGALSEPVDDGVKADLRRSTARKGGH